MNKLCESCGEYEATVHVKQVVNGAVSMVHLCEACARESGLSMSGVVPLSDILLGLGGQDAADAEENGADARVCPVCGLSLGDFKKTSRLGCQECYEAFHAELESLLGAMHRSTRHVGKSPAKYAREAVETEKMDDLQRQLKVAIQGEAFEEAARVRDRIRVIESGVGESGARREEVRP